MPQTIKVKRRVTGAAGAPATLLSGELAWNMQDSGTGILYGGKGDDGAGNATSVVALAGTKSLPLTAHSDVTITTPLLDQVLRYNGTTWVNNITVTSVGLSLPNIFTVSNSPVTTTGTLTGTLANQNANIVFAGPSTGSAAAPTFRSLVSDDIPSLAPSKITNFDTQVRTSRLDQLAVPTLSVSLNNNTITNLADPVNAQDAATKAYVDAARQGLDTKDSVRVATTVNVALTGATTTVIDSITLVVGDRILVKNQTAGAENGIYVYATGAWSRATDANSNSKVTSGLFVFVESGTVNSDSGWVLTTDGAITLGTTALSFTQFSGAGQITAGAGLTKTANTIDLGTASTSRIVVNADNIDLALVTQTDTSGTAGINFLQSITKDSYGRISGTVLADVRTGTTAQTGVLQLTDSTSSTSTTTAATPNSVKTSWDLANAALARSGGSMTGKLNLVNATTSLVSANIGSGTADPTTVVSGDFWVNTGAIKYNNGTTTRTLAFLDSTITGNAANVTGIVAGTNGGTGINNGSRTITLGGNLTTSGAFNTTFTVTATTSLTLPTTGTLATQDWAQPVNTRLTTISGWSADQVTTAGALPTATTGFVTKASATTFSTVGSTGTGNVVLANGPTLTGTTTMASATITGTLVVDTINIDGGTF